MKIAVLGAGLAGLSAAQALIKTGAEITLLEKEAQAGGAAGGFKLAGWDWYLDYSYHHWFTNDYKILELCKKIGFKQIISKTPITATSYGEHQEYKLDTPLDLLKFARLPFFDRLRTGLVLAFLKFGPKLASYDQIPAKVFLSRTMGKKAYEILWEPLLLKKFEKQVEQINMAFFWARIKKRTQSLNYPSGGFQNFINHFSTYLQTKEVKIHLNTEVKQITKSNSKFQILNTKTQKAYFDLVVNTLPSPLFLKLEHNLLPQNYRNRLAQIQYLGAQTIIYQSKQPILPKIYWLNLANRDNPWMVAVQHTNFMNKEHYGNNHLLYLGKYTNEPTRFVNSKFPRHVEGRQIPPLRQGFAGQANSKIINSTFIKFAQPLYTIDYPKYKPDYITPVPGLYFANLELTYPYDRGTNYAVEVGQEVVRRISARERT